jgi:uncharacterized protein (DUF305 family)
MVNKALLYGISGFILGGLVVSIAATTFDKNDSALEKSPTSSKSVGDTSMKMNKMTEVLMNLEGDDYDRAFLSNMVTHHQAAVDMAKMTPVRAKHEEIKQLSKDIITAQQKEITQMKQWQKDWGYDSSPMDPEMHEM